MFKDDYKNCFNDIKGDRQLLNAILEKADAAPVKTVRFKHVYQYAASFAAVFVLAGAVFLWGNGVLNYESPSVNENVNTPTQNSEDITKNSLPSVNSDVNTESEPTTNTPNDVYNYNDSSNSESTVPDSNISNNKYTKPESKENNLVSSAQSSTDESAKINSSESSENFKEEISENNYGVSNTQLMATNEDYSSKADEIRGGSGGGSSANNEKRISSESNVNENTKNAPIPAESSLEESAGMLETDNIPYNESADKSKSSEPAFSYKEEINIYKNNKSGVKYNGFKNTSKFVISNSRQAIERAKIEVTLEYTGENVWYDSSEDIWKVLFYNEATIGNDQTVYLTGNGITKLIVYGE